MTINPCPFCGADECVIIAFRSNAYVKCKNCNARGPTSEYFIEAKLITAKADAIIGWNQLVIEDANLSMVKMFTAEIKRLKGMIILDMPADKELCPVCNEPLRVFKFYNCVCGIKIRRI